MSDPSALPLNPSENSPNRPWDIDVCMQLSTLNFGIFLVYWIDYAFSSTTASYAWRVPVILQCIFLLAMLGLIALVPESPRWLAAHDRAHDSLAVLRRLRAHELDDASILQLHGDILRAVAQERAIGSGSWKTLLKADRIHSRRRLLIACGIQAFQQLGGINPLVCKPPIHRILDLPFISVRPLLTPTRTTPARSSSALG